MDLKKEALSVPMVFVLNSLGLKMVIKLHLGVSSNSYNLKHSERIKYAYIIMKNYMEN